MSGGILVILGVLFLLNDLNYISFWKVNWWTVGFLLAGIIGFCKSCCPECQKMCGMDEGKKKK